MADYLRSSPPIDPAHPVMMPGEREQRAMAGAGDVPILVDGPTWASMLARAGDRIAVPRPEDD